MMGVGFVGSFIGGGEWGARSSVETNVVCRGVWRTAVGGERRRRGWRTVVGMTAEVTTEEVLELTLENVEMVLDEVRPYLMADGGNCSVFEIDGATVKLLLEGACGSCASSAVTMSMGIEKRLKERIPEIESVVQVSPSGPTLDEENVEKVLDEVRPFLNVAGGKIALVSITGVDGPQPMVRLSMTGTGSAINSVKMEITQRLRRNFPSIGQVIIK